jgi:hypothetical protein
MNEAPNDLQLKITYVVVEGDDNRPAASSPPQTVSIPISSALLVKRKLARVTKKEDENGACKK